MTLVFAYGSNLCERRLTRRVPSARYVARARLPAHELRFHKRGFRDGSGKANALATGNALHTVWGALFTVRRDDKAQLDRAEGVGFGYESEAVLVQLDNGATRRAEAYIAVPDAIDDALRPFHWYLDYVVAGARERALPADYIAALAAVPSVADPDAARARDNQLAHSGPAIVTERHP